MHTMKTEKSDLDLNEVTTTAKELPPYSVQLDEPIKRGDQVIDVITLRKPKAGELRGLSLTELLNLDVAALSKLLPRISQPTLTEHDISQLDPVDLVALGAEAVGFFVPKAAKADSPSV
jgi:hypothetical protein